MKILLNKTFLIIILLFLTANLLAQKKSIKDLNFLIGKWKVREDNKEKKWWEECERTGRYIMDSTYIELESIAISSTGHERTYRWYIHYNSKGEKFEMIALFSNWHNVQYNTLRWNQDTRTLTINNGDEPKSNEYEERNGEIIFNEKFDSYTWKGENKYGDPNNLSVWNYIEKGTRVK